MDINTIEDFTKALDNGPYAWPGGYPLYFICADGGVLSFKAAQAERKLIEDALADPGTDKQWQVVATEINWEDGDLVCDHTGKKIECAYDSYGEVK